MVMKPRHTYVVGRTSGERCVGYLGEWDIWECFNKSIDVRWFTFVSAHDYFVTSIESNFVRNVPALAPPEIAAYLALKYGLSR